MVCSCMTKCQDFFGWKIFLASHLSSLSASFTFYHLKVFLQLSELGAPGTLRREAEHSLSSSWWAASLGIHLQAFILFLISTEVF